MTFGGKVYKGKKFWISESETLDAMTQGTSKGNAIEMLIDWIRLEVDKPGVKVKIVECPTGNLTIETSHDAAVVGVILRRERARRGLSVREVARLLGSKNPNSYAAYESGKREPSVSKFEELLHTLNPERKLQIK